MDIGTIIVLIIVALAIVYVVYTTIKKYIHLSRPVTHGSCNGHCGHCCDNCPFAKYSEECLKKKNGGGGCCCG